MSITAEMKPFPVVHGKYLFWFTPEDVGFSVVCQNVPGVNAQGDTFEEALEHALSMAPFVEECLAERPALKASGRKGAAPKRRKTPPRTRK